ncbi:hypothetical protein C8R45DRAFT_934783 [Mycena sanguinolenta]|nr:hypothetical protein C8R45DRAFT_934783 [Mycena sanguinolenta]
MRLGFFNVHKNSPERSGSFFHSVAESCYNCSSVHTKSLRTASKADLKRGAARAESERIFAESHGKLTENHGVSHDAVEMSLPNVKMLLPDPTVRGGGREFNAGERQRAVERSVRRRAKKWELGFRSVCGFPRA